MKWLKENIFLALIILVVLAWTILSNLRIIMDIGDGSFLKGIILLPIVIAGCVIIFKAFEKLGDEANKEWKTGVFLIVMVASLMGFVELIKGL